MSVSIILDIDNCCSDDSWRIPRIRWDIEDTELRYDDYHSLSPWDAPGNFDLWQGHNHGIIIMTARPERFRAITEEWLRRAGIKLEIIMMRNNGEYGPSVDIKAAQLKTLEAIGYKIPFDIVMAFDDHPGVIAMYKKHGVPGEVRAIHNVSAYERSAGSST